ATLPPPSRSSPASGSLSYPLILPSLHPQKRAYTKPTAWQNRNFAGITGPRRNQRPTEAEYYPPAKKQHDGNRRHRRPASSFGVSPHLARKPALQSRNLDPGRRRRLGHDADDGLSGQGRPGADRLDAARYADFDAGGGHCGHA